MAGAAFDRAAGRAAARRQEFAELIAAGETQAAVSRAAAGVLSETSKVGRRRPRDAGAIQTEVAEALLDLADQVSDYKPTGQH